MTGGTHRDGAVPAGLVKVGVLGALATATIAAPLAAAAAGVDDDGALEPQALPTTGSQESDPAEVEPVALPMAVDAETREDDGSASRSEDRAEPVAEAEGDDAADAEAEESGEADDATSDEAEEGDEGTGLSVELPPEVEVEAEGGIASADGEATSSSGYLRPAGPITSNYGYRIHPVLGTSKLHNGTDFGSACGTPVESAQSGTVIAVEYNSASGNRVKVDHGDGNVTGYYHLQGFNTSVGASVEQGEVIGYVGSTGRSTGCHLHFSVMDQSGNYSDPMTLLR